VQALSWGDKEKRHEVCVAMLEKMKNAHDYLNKIVFGDKATSHLSGKVNRHNVRIWGTENPHETVEHMQDLPNLNFLCAVSSVKVYGPFCFAEPAVTGMPQLQQDMDRDFTFQQDGSPPHLHREVTSYVNRTVLTWTGRGGKIAWPPRSPDLSPLDFSIWGYLKDKVFVLPLPASLEELRARMTETVATINADMIHRIWDEISYRWDICRVT
jgi:hypothetical protein